MKICAAQTRPVTGDIPANIGNHDKLIGLAVAGKADLIIFPELSLTGYEPTWAKKLAVKWDDARLDVFQEISDTRHIPSGWEYRSNAARSFASVWLFFNHTRRGAFIPRATSIPTKNRFLQQGKAHLI